MSIIEKANSFSCETLLSSVYRRLLADSRLILSMLYGGGAFLSFILLAYITKQISSIDEAGIFLAFYSIVYSGGSFASLGLYSRAPSWVLRDCDANGLFRHRSLVRIVVFSAAFISLIALLQPNLLILGGMPLILMLAGILQVAVLMMLCGFSNGYRKFHCSRLNFVLVPNFLACVIIGLSIMSPMHGLVLTLLISNVAHYLLIQKLSSWRSEVSETGKKRQLSAFSLKMILPVSILSIMPQLDVWVFSQTLSGEEIFVYTFFARFLMIPMFPVIAFNNVMYSTLPTLACKGDFEGIEENFFGKYHRVRMITLMAIIALPLIAYIVSYSVGVQLDVRAILLIASLILGYGLISFFPPYEVLAYAFEAQSRVLGLTICALTLVLVGLTLVAQTPLVWFGPLIAATAMLSIRFAYFKIYHSIRSEGTDT